MSGTWPDCRGQLVGEQINQSSEERSIPDVGGGGHKSVPSTTLQIRAGAGSPLTPEADWAQFKDWRRRSPGPPILLGSSLWPTGSLHELHLGLGEGRQIPRNLPQPDLGGLPQEWDLVQCRHNQSPRQSKIN